jgi:tRNA-dihydrouridine synthase B
MLETARDLGVCGVSVGAVALDGRAFLAPMSGITDVGMRRIARRFGAALVISEMVACQEFVSSSSEARLRAEGEGVHPHVVQIAGCDPRWMAEAARLAEASGADAIDVNMGCPAKRVTGGWSGSALMRDLALAQTLIEATVKAVKVPVTLKMRLGWDASNLNAPQLSRRAEEAGIRLLTVHGRTRSMFYAGRADWAAIREVKAAVTTPVVANCDCGSVEDARAMLAQSGADAVMIGRAAVGRPWLVGAIARALATGASPVEPPAAVRRDAALEHLQTLVDAMGPHRGLRHARKHLAAYADHAAAGRPASLARERDRLRLVTSESVLEAHRLLAAFFDDSERKEAA